MSLLEILLMVILLLTIVNIVIVLTRKSAVDNGQVLNEIERTKSEILRIDPLIRSEFSNNREELQRSAKDTREELSSSFKNLSDALGRNITDLTAIQKTQLDTFSSQLQTLIKSNEEKIEKLIGSNEQKMKEFNAQFSNAITEIKEGLNRSLKTNEEKTDKLIVSFTENTKLLNDNLSNSAKENRLELTSSLKSFETRFDQNVKEFNELQRQKFNDLAVKQDQIKTDTENKLEKIRETVETKLNALQVDNTKKLEEMRATVDEKLSATLEKRFNESFTVISERLEQVHKGLGEMQSLASNVGDLKKIMTNVKSRGIMGEYQLANIIEDLLTNEQYEKNVKTKSDSGAIVEFAIKMPNGNNLEKTLWLPIDSKFPKEDYEALIDAYEESDQDKIDSLRRAFRSGIIKNARDIKEKYIDPPNTTEYGIMFLPFESLYAEVLRIPGLFESLQKDYKITITGPTTLSALLNSLQMGFRTLAIEKRSSEVWDLLSTVKTEFSRFGTILEKTKKKLQEATNTIDQAGVRSRAIERQLRKVQELPSSIDVISQIEQSIQNDSEEISDNILNVPSIDDLRV